MVEIDIKLPIFNGNGMEDREQHWFLCDAIRTVGQIQDENIKKAQIIMTLQVCALDRYMKFSIVPVGFIPNKLN